jgi:hypothetical protein
VGGLFAGIVAHPEGERYLPDVAPVWDRGRGEKMEAREKNLIDTVDEFIRLGELVHGVPLARKLAVFIHEEAHEMHFPDLFDAFGIVFAAMGVFQNYAEGEEPYGSVLGGVVAETLRATGGPGDALITLGAGLSRVAEEIRHCPCGRCGGDE